MQQIVFGAGLLAQLLQSHLILSFPFGSTNLRGDEKKYIKTSVCTGTHGGSETSFNTVVHENIKVYYESVCEIFFEISLNFFKNCPQLIVLKIVQIYQNV